MVSAGPGSKQPGQALGNGTILWFEAADFDAAVSRIRASGAELVTDVHLNPSAGHREIRSVPVIR